MAVHHDYRFLHRELGHEREPSDKLPMRGRKNGGRYSQIASNSQTVILFNLMWCNT